MSVYRFVFVQRHHRYSYTNRCHDHWLYMKQKQRWQGDAVFQTCLRNTLNFCSAPTWGGRETSKKPLPSSAILYCSAEQLYECFRNTFPTCEPPSGSSRLVMMESYHPVYCRVVSDGDQDERKQELFVCVCVCVSSPRSLLIPTFGQFAIHSPDPLANDQSDEERAARATEMRHAFTFTSYAYSHANFILTGLCNGIYLMNSFGYCHTKMQACAQTVVPRQFLLVSFVWRFIWRQTNENAPRHSVAVHWDLLTLQTLSP